MKLSFSSRGWCQSAPDKRTFETPLTFEQLQDVALEMGYTGIELYGVQKSRSWIERGGPLHAYNIAATGRTLREKRLSIPCLDTSLNLLAEEDPTPDLLRLIALAGDLRVGCVSAKAQKEDGSDHYSEQCIRERLGKLLPEAESCHVTLLIKTDGIYSDTAALRHLLDGFANDHLAALWDVHHPYRDCGESADTTIKNLGAYVRHVHLRDSDDAAHYNLVGEGSFPIDDVMAALSSVDYDGFISLEWKPEWMPELPYYDVIFPHFINYMHRFENTRGKKQVLYPNHDGTGYYVWKKDELISQTFGDVLDKMVEAFPDQMAFKYTTLDYSRTYSEFREDVDRFARALVALGVTAGKKVAVWATNVPAWYIAFWACARIGAVLVTMNTAYKSHEADYLLRQSDTHTLIMIRDCLDSDYQGIINELCPEIKDSTPGEPLHCRRLPFLRNVITVGFRQPGCLTFEEAMQRSEAVSQETILRMAGQVRPDDVVNMQYTSGTTGFPKGVMLTHYNVVNNGKCIGDRMGLSTADRMMIQVPMFHCFGMVLSMTASMTHGTTICPLPYFSAKSSLACINQERITCFNGVPTMFIAMFNHPDYLKTDFSYIRTGIMAGSGCPPELMRRAAKPADGSIYGGMNMRGIVSVYGQTESAPGSTMSSWTDDLNLRTNTVGYAFPHVQCKIIDPETGEIVADGVNGEFCSKGYNTMKGYYKMPEATRETVDSEGWLHSGDLACKTPEGNYLITGRLKDMIIRGGENLYPKEIEEFIYTHPAVQDVQVIGVPDEKYGEEAMACIILKAGEKVTETEMHDYIAASMARHKVPKYIRFTKAFPMNAAGKILKYKMRENAIKSLKNQ